MKTIETIEKSNSLKHRIYTKDVNGDILHIGIRLNDECKNGHQDFAITASCYNKKGGGSTADKWFLYGGCSHDDILKVCPELQQFVDLHLCDYNGAPMYAEANGFYHLQEARKDPSKMEMAREYVRATTEEWAILASAEAQNQK